MWTPPKLQKEEALEKMQNQFDKIDQQMVNQRYVQTSQQQKEMFLGRMQSHMQRLGGRFEQQDAMTKQEFRDYKFDEVDKILDTVPKQYEEQRSTKRASGSRSNSVSKKSPDETTYALGLAAPLAEVTKSQELDQMADLLARVPRMDTQTAQSAKLLQVREQKPLVVPDLQVEDRTQVTKSQELDQMADLLARVPRMDKQTAQSAKLLQAQDQKALGVPELDRNQVTKSQELDQMADLLARVPRMDTQTAQSSKLLQVREQQALVVPDLQVEDRHQITKSQELDQVANLLARVPRIDDQAATSRKMLQVQSANSHLIPPKVEVTLSQELDQISSNLDKGRMDNQSAVMKSDAQDVLNAADVENRKQMIDHLPVVQTPLPTLSIDKESDKPCQEPVAC
jgi:predicted house-cleaning noncanonical NTP pyrophosphatase (MazG superfamily)